METDLPNTPAEPEPLEKVDDWLKEIRDLQKRIEDLEGGIETLREKVRATLQRHNQTSYKSAVAQVTLVKGRDIVRVSKPESLPEELRESIWKARTNRILEYYRTTGLLPGGVEAIKLGEDSPSIQIRFSAEAP